jgi:hypothetical protein
MKALILALVLIIPAIIALSYTGGITVGFKRGQRSQSIADLRSIGLTVESARRYREAIALLNGMVNSTELDGVYGGNVLTNHTAAEAVRLVNGYRKEMGI